MTYLLLKFQFQQQKSKNEIVKYCDFIYEKSNITSKNKIEELKELNKLCLENQIKYGQIEEKTLSEICTFLPKSKRLASYGNDIGQYNFYTSSQICNKYCDIPDYTEYSLIIGTGGVANIKYDKDFSCSSHNTIIKSNNEMILIKYIYYYLLNNMEILENGFVGLGIKNLSNDYITNIKIPIPTIEKQNEIVKYCDYNDSLIKQLEQEIINNTNQAKQYLISFFENKQKKYIENNEFKC